MQSVKEGPTDAEFNALTERLSDILEVAFIGECATANEDEIVKTRSLKKVSVPADFA